VADVLSASENLGASENLSAEVDVAAIRARFSSLRQGFAFFDAPGGTQVPDEVGEAIARALREASANLGAGYATSIRVGQILEEAEHKAARFLGCEPHEVIFGPNMTSLNFALSRTAARAFQPGDEILVSCLDHDAGVAPWLEIAHDRDLVVRHVALHDDTTLDFADLESKLGPRTRVVAFAWASNAVGTVTDARRVCQLAHDFGALAWVDAVHYAAHEPIDVRAIGADVLICSPYKFCGPHLGVAAGRSEVLAQWRPYKARPAPTSPLGRSFETGTQSYELLAGFNATIDYLDSIGGIPAIGPYERALGQRFLDGLSDAVTVYGRPGMAGRVPTFLVNVDGVAAEDVAARLADAQMGVWAHDSWYSLGLYQQLGYTGKSVRIGFIHYNSPDEVDRLTGALNGLRLSRALARWAPCYPSAPPRISASLSRLMLPPETTHTTFPVPARPLSAAAGASAPAPSAMTRTRSASVRTAAATSATGMATASSTSGATCGHMLSSTRRLPEPSTNEGR
jgi:cysteine desulfurase family protein (TIGR01976 family)